MEVILIAGKGRHGKDTTGNIIEEYLKEKENGTLKTYSHKEVWGE